MLISYHNHTVWSDGESTLEEMIAGGQAAGLDELGISDHFVCSADGRQHYWAMPNGFLEEYAARLQAAAGETQGLTLRVGVEADYFPETVEAVKARIDTLPFDYVIASVHIADGFPIDEYKSQWDALSEKERNATWRLYWQRLREMAESGLGDIVGHLDLPKKFGYRPTVDLTAEEDAVLDAIAAAGMCLEINTAGWKKEAAEAYPSLDLLQRARRRAIPLLINADAHQASHLTSDFDRARALARQAGYTSLCRYQRRQRYSYPL